MMPIEKRSLARCFRVEVCYYQVYWCVVRCYKTTPDSTYSRVRDCVEQMFSPTKPPLLLGIYQGWLARRTTATTECPVSVRVCSLP